MLEVAQLSKTYGEVLADEDATVTDGHRSVCPAGPSGCAHPQCVPVTISRAHGSAAPEPLALAFRTKAVSTASEAGA